MFYILWLHALFVFVFTLKCLMLSDTYAHLAAALMFMWLRKLGDDRVGRQIRTTACLEYRMGTT